VTFSLRLTAAMPRAYAHAATWAVLLTFPALAGAATLSSDGSAALSLDYDSNPLLLPSHTRSAEAAALLVNLPLTYTSDAQSFDLLPRFRYAQTHGASELLTDYEYLDADWRLNGERNSLISSAGWHRDSTFYNTYESAALRGRDLPRLEETAGLAWQRTLSERSNLQLSGSWDQVGYSAVSGLRLYNYSDVQGSIQYVRALSERWSWTTSTGISRYQQRGSETSNQNRFLQSSLSWVLTERWSTTAQLGYSRLNSSAQAFICCAIASTSSGLSLVLIPVAQESSAGTLDYSLSIQRQSERLNWSLSASRSVQPSGLGVPLTQESVNLGASVPWTERLTVGTTLNATRLSDALASRGQVSRGMYGDFGLYANWQWTELWTVGLLGTYRIQRALAQAPQESNVNVALTLTRAFGRVTL
jgi:hypothetical protein